MTTEDVYALARRYGDIASWARAAGYDGIQLASSNAKLLDQFLSPFYNRRSDEFGGDVERRARVLRLIREEIAERAGPDFTTSVKIPVGEKSPPGTPHVSVADGLRMARLAEEWGFDAVTPVEVSVFPDTTLSRGGVPRSIWDNKAIAAKFQEAAPQRSHRKVIEAGYWFGGRASPFRPVWTREHFRAVKQEVGIPVFAVGGIRTREEVDGILDTGQSDMVGIGRPFYAEPDVVSRLLADPGVAVACQNSNLCVPAQMLGMKGVCYNPEVKRGVRAATHEPDGGSDP
jgi:2,4-dienoyl-CoA reductase-like NADH-dependent reductase (Old Yellow Enzyme family)